MLCKVDLGLSFRILNRSKVMTVKMKREIIEVLKFYHNLNVNN